MYVVALSRLLVLESVLVGIDLVHMHIFPWSELWMCQAGTKLDALW